MTNIRSHHESHPSTSETMSFGSHRNSDVPVSAYSTGIGKPAWQTRGVAQYSDTSEPARNLLDIALDPLRIATKTAPRKAGLTAFFLLMVVFTFILG